MAEEMALVRIRHRQIISHYRELAEALLAEVIGVTERPELVDELVDALVPVNGMPVGADATDIRVGKAQEDRHRKLEDATYRVCSTAGRSKTLKDLTDVIAKLIALERQAFDLDDKEESPEVPPDRSMDPEAHYKWLVHQRRPA